MTEGTDYVVHQTLGRIELIPTGKGASGWSRYPRANRIVLASGFIDPADASPPANALQAPGDLQRGIIQQATVWWNHRKTEGLKSVNAGKGATTQFQTSDIHPTLEAACQALRRISL